MFIQPVPENCSIYSFSGLKYASSSFENVYKTVITGFGFRDTPGPSVFFHPITAGSHYGYEVPHDVGDRLIKDIEARGFGKAVKGYTADNVWHRNEITFYHWEPDYSALWSFADKKKWIPKTYTPLKTDSFTREQQQTEKEGARAILENAGFTPEMITRVLKA